MPNKGCRIERVNMATILFHTQKKEAFFTRYPHILQLCGLHTRSSVTASQNGPRHGGICIADFVRKTSVLVFQGLYIIRTIDYHGFVVWDQRNPPFLHTVRDMLQHCFIR